MRDLVIGDDMKTYSAHSVVTVALLIACVLACKLGSNKTVSSNNNIPTNKSTNAPRTSTSTPPDIAGSYNIAGTNPTGTLYKGTLQIIPHGNVYQFRWNVGAQYDGVGVENQNVV